MNESSPPHCRLCLTTFPESDRKDRLLDILQVEEDNFSLKIRDCTGVHISEEDSADTTVCVNCIETIHLVDEFRKLCHRSEKQYGSFLPGETSSSSSSKEDLERWEAYRHHVGELRKLLPGDSPEESFFKPMMVKQEDEEVLEEEVLERDGDLGFEWADPEDLLEIKQEVDEGEEEDESGEEEEEDVPKRKKAKVEPNVDQLTLAKAIHKFPALWDTENKGFHERDARDQAWTCLASETGLDEAQLKREFNRLYDTFWRRNTDVCDELYQLLETVFSSREVGKVRISKTPEDEAGLDERLRLARVVYEHEAIWNKNHEQYESVSKWKKVAKECGLGVDELKRQWKGLRDIYHARRRRILAGTIGLDNRLLQEPLHVLLEKMLAGNTNPKTKPVPVGEEVVTVSGDERVKLAELIHEKEIIWNRGHPLHNDLVRRDEAFSEVAGQLKLSMEVLKAEWRKLRNLYRVRKLRFLEGKISANNSQLNDPLYLLLEKMLRDNMDVGKRSTVLEPTEQDEESSSTPQYDRLSLAQAFYEREVIWNRSHSLFNAPRAREEAYREIAEQHQMTLAEIRNQWKSLRDGYRVRKKRLLANPNDENAIHATLNPVHLLMDQMSQDVKRSNEPPKPKPTPSLKTRRTKCKPDADLRLTIASAIHAEEVLWNRSHQHFGDQKKRETTWEQIATALEMPLAELKQHWKLLRDLYRGRMVRVSTGKISPEHPFLRQPLYQMLDEMLRDNIDVGKFSKAKPLKQLRRQQQLAAKRKVEEDEDEEQDGEENKEDEGAEQKPFEDPELRARLAEEIKKHELLWNVNHVDYSRGSLRGAVWTEIGAQFGLDRSHPIKTWRLVSHRHRRLRELYGTVGPELIEQDPLHRMLHEVVYGGTDAKESGTGDDNGKLWPPKRRYTGKKVYSDEGCIKVMQNGSPHYLKFCELCGKNVERSDFEYHMNRHNGLTPYACSYEGCDKRYGSKITRDRHEITVHTAAAERFECEQCGEKFKYRSKLDYHIAVHHQSQYHPCPVCGKDLKHKSALRNHMRVHTQCYPCGVCGRVLQKKHALDVHMRIHTNEKPFPCPLCTHSFRIKVLLKTHLQRMHNVELEELEAAAARSSSGSGQ